ncbi:MAG: hypothetical protein IH599_03485, partial [Bacteroidales bacterium]|nr:hypothetical protein [Bacteroidales bacterium]
IMYDTSSFTLSVWVYRPSATYGVYIMHGSPVGGNFNYNIQGSATGITNFGANKQGAAWIWCTAPYSSGIWEHFAGTYENMVLKLYKNGVLISTNNYTHTNVNATTLPFYVGRGVSGNYVAATLDDIGVWGRALSPAEIWDMYMACSSNLITTQPLSQSANLLDDALFTVAATPGAGYQWQAHSGSGIFNDIYDGGQFSGTVTDSLIISDLTLANQGTWLRCVVFEGTCVDTSDPAMLSVDCIPAISIQPVSQTVAAWTNASFPLSLVDPQAVLQWQKKNGSVWNNLSDGGMYSGSQTATLVVSGVQLSNSGEQYRCVADLLGCPDTSGVVTLTVSPQVGLPETSVNATVG